MKYYVYWYHLEAHTNMSTEGYIGITNNLLRRAKEHKYSANKSNATYIQSHFTHAINKYGLNSIKRTIVYEGNFKTACVLEKTFRPTLNIGWNMAVGGEHPGAVNMFKGVRDRWTEEQKKAIGSAHSGKKLSAEHVEILRTKNRASTILGTPITLFHKDDHTKTYTYHSISEASRQLSIPLPRLKSKHFRKNTSYGNDGWAIQFEPSFDRSTTPTGRQLAGKAISKTLNKKKDLGSA